MTDSLTVEQAEQYLLSKAETSLYYPFGDGVKVFRVKNKMFATLALGKMGNGDNQDWWLNLKCEPSEAIMLREIFPAIIPGYHMNKRLWNTIILDGSIPQGEIERMMDNSFMLVVNKMTKKDQQSIFLYLGA
ncbi:MAG: putative DNA-binding protein (MmcQ/YjbR family) [Paraglaciecola sp.]|jgi:predicted DNA-binding protein (MmcQ/YjbR family)